MEKRCVSCFGLYDSEYEMCPYCGYYEGDTPDEINQLPIGTILNNRYIVGRVLGFGGFGITYKVWDKKLSTVCAVKEFFPSSFVNRNPNTNEIIIFSEKRKAEFDFGLSRFLDEAQNMAKFNTHENIVNVYEYFEENKTAYIVMEFLDGESLNICMQNEHISIDQSIDIVLKICSALKDIHKVGIVHRDISPDNIFICKDGKVKLIDFGAARFSSSEEKQRTIILKPGFAPPEQYESVSVQGAWTDIYALGATLYYLLTGVKPEESTNRRIKDEIAPPHVLNPEISENVSNAVMKAMALDRHLRFASVEDFEQAINNKKKVIPLKLEVKKRKIRRFIGALAGTLAVVMIGIVFMVGYKKEKSENTLPKASIEMWYIIDKDHPTEQKKALESIAQDFCGTYNTVTIAVIGHEREDYEAKLNAAIEAGKLPAVFEDFGENGIKTEDLKSTLSSAADKYESLFIKEYVKNGDTSKAPLGFECLAVFQNIKLADKTISMKNINDIKYLVADGMVAAPEMASVFSKDIPDITNVCAENADDLFINEKSPLLISGSSTFFKLNSKMAGKYKMIIPVIKKVYCSPKKLFCVSSLSEDEIVVSKTFIEYMFCAKYQEIYHVDGESGAFPMNKVAWNSFLEIYPSFSEFKSDIENGTICTY